jgi:hypothetical protein
MRVLRGAAGGHLSSFCRVLSRARWAPAILCCVLASAVLELIAEGAPVVCSVDDTTAQHRGPKVYGKARHRDACRSTKSHTVWVWGHRWVVLAIHVKFSFAKRAWALPVSIRLYKSAELNKAEGAAHLTPIAIAQEMLAQLLAWFPERKFILLGDGGYASHGLARFVHDHRRQLTLVSLLHPEACMYEPPPPRPKGMKGRNRVRGQKLPHPAAVVAQSKRKRLTVDWYAANRRKVEYVTGTGHWYKATEGLVKIRWVFVHDRQGRMQDRYFYSTDPSMSPSKIIALYTARWSIEVTFQEVKQRLGFATSRNRTPKSVERTGMFLMSLYTVVALIYRKQIAGRKPRIGKNPGHQKLEPTFSDALASVRRVLWDETIFSEAFGHDALNKLKPKVRDVLLDELSLAA